METYVYVDFGLLTERGEFVCADPVGTSSFSVPAEDAALARNADQPVHQARSSRLIYLCSLSEMIVLFIRISMLCVSYRLVFCYLGRDLEQSSWSMYNVRDLMYRSRGGRILLSEERM